MLEIMQAGGWLMVPILLCSIVAAAICGERLWSLQRSRVMPENLLARTWTSLKNSEFDAQRLRELRTGSALGSVFAAGIANSRRGRETAKLAMTEATDQVSHELERYLTALGSIASISPLLGLLGTVWGMIDVFRELMAAGGGGDTSLLAGGIAKALITTAAGLTVAIPAMTFHRYFMRRVDELVVGIEHESGKLADIMHSDTDDPRF